MGTEEQFQAPSIHSIVMHMPWAGLLPNITRSHAPQTCGHSSGARGRRHWPRFSLSCPVSRKARSTPKLRAGAGVCAERAGRCAGSANVSSKCSG